MDDENLEQQTVEAEPKADASKKEQAETSQKTNTEASEGKEDKTEKTYTEAEVAELVKKQAQSLKDKELKGVYADLEQARAEAKKVKDEITQREAEAKLASQEKAEAEKWAEDGVPETTIKSFQETRRELTKKVADYNNKVPDIRQAAAFTLAVESLKEILPDGEKVISSINDFVTSLLEAESEREMRALARVKAYELKGILSNPTQDAKPDKEPKKRPDSGAHSAPGGMDISKLSPKEKIEAGLKQKK